MKKAITLFLAMSLVFLLIGCGKTSEPQTYYATSATLSAYGKELYKALVGLNQRKSI